MAGREPTAHAMLPPSTMFFLLLMATSTSSSSSSPHQHHHHRYANSSGTGSRCLPHERDALLAFKQGITDDPSGLLASWHQGREEEEDCCQWRGVRCSNRTGYIVGLHLSNAQADNDKLYIEDTALNGEISASLLSLHHLEHLDLSLNNLSGPTGRVPEFLGQLNNLRHLNLSGIPFLGRLPPQLGNLSKLQYLDLSVNPDFFPWRSKLNSTDISWLSNLPLRHLNMGSVDLSMVADWAQVVNMIPSLKVLRLPRCHLQNANQSLSHLNLTDLQELSLHGNYFENPVASCWFWNLTSLQRLDLAGTQLYGQIPDVLGNLSKLNYLDLSSSVGSIPCDSILYSNDISWLSSLPLQYLNMESVNLSMVSDWVQVVNMIPSLKVLRLPCCSLATADQSLPHLNLTYLEELSLSRNDFDNPVASCWFWNLTSLQHLEVARTYLYGQIPQVLGGMASLRVLDFSSSFQGIDITKANMKSLCNLETLDLSSCDMNGDILEFLPQCSSNKLKELHLSYNNLTGVLPDWIGHRWSSLIILDLSYNQFIGHVPSEIGMLSNLTVMYLNNNNLTGVITHEHLGGLISLRAIDLSSNHLKVVVDSEWLPPFRLESVTFASCQLGPLFPTWLRSQIDIVELLIPRTSIFDRLPEWFVTTFSNASVLDISNNGIEGNLPTNMKNMTSLALLYLNSNNLTGALPQLPMFLQEFDISDNSLSGPLPSHLGAQYLEYLNMASNRLSGPIPQSICQLKHLGELNLANNLFDGQLPLCFEPWAAMTLILSNNKLSGKFPPSLKTWKNLYILDLAWNKFSGRLPTWIGDFATLKILQLSHNMFTGSIPAEITRLTSLSQLSLASNSISGPLPHHLSNLTSMKAGDYPHPGATWYSYGGYVAPSTGSRAGPLQPPVNLPVTTKGQERYYRDYGLDEMVSIDVSSNQLAGEIPEEITSLDGVRNLNLSWNQFNGKLMGNIGAMKSLESLDLKENKLYGEIPQSLSNVTSLSCLDLSYNNLSGRIPSGGQLDTLYAQNPLMYAGNVGLCGHPLPKNCSCNSKPKHEEHQRDEHDSEVLSFSFALGVGYVVGLWVVFCVILFKKSWRVAYFRLFDKACHQVYVFVVVTWASLAQRTVTHIDK